MKITDLIDINLEFFTLGRMMIIAGLGLMSLIFDSRLMAKRGFMRESLWSVIFGVFHIVWSTGVWIAALIWK